MSELKKYKIEKLITFSNPFTPLYDEYNFISSKEPCGAPDISELVKKNIYPFSFDFYKKKVVFIETKKAISHNETAFFHEPLQLSAEYLIHVPFTELSKLSSGTQNKNSNFLFIHHPGRCGSTLLHKILGSNPNVESFSEDLILDNLFWRMYYQKPSFNEVRSIYTCLLDFYKIIWGDSDRKIISLKMPSISHHYIDLIFKMLPDSRHIYLTRDPIDITISIENAWRRNARSGDKEKSNQPKLIKSELLDYSDLEAVNDGMFMKGGYGQYICNNIPSNMKSTIGPIDTIERSILRVLLIDNFYNSIKTEKMMFLNYTNLFNKELLFKTLRDFLSLDNKCYFNKEVYSRHSQTNETYQSANTKYFDLTNEQKTKYSLFAEHIKEIILSKERNKKSERSQNA